MDHDQKPIKQPVPFEFQNKLEEISKTTYFQLVKKLGEQIKDKVVVASMVGHTGYLLHFEDRSWLLCYLEKEKLEWLMGEDREPTSQELSLLQNQAHLNGQEPIDIDLPYADEENKIFLATLKTHGKMVTGVSIGQNDFGICFPNGRELEAHVFLYNASFVLRVFWEQW